MIGGQNNGKNNVKRTIADSTYNSNENFRFQCQNDIEPAIMVRKNSSLSREGRGRSMTHIPRKEVVVLNKSKLRDGNMILIMDIDRYGRNSTLLYQKVFGECVPAKFPKMVKEIKHGKRNVSKCIVT